MKLLRSKFDEVTVETNKGHEYTYKLIYNKQSLIIMATDNIGMLINLARFMSYYASGETIAETNLSKVLNEYDKTQSKLYGVHKTILKSEL